MDFFNLELAHERHADLRRQAAYRPERLRRRTARRLHRLARVLDPSA